MPVEVGKSEKAALESMVKSGAFNSEEEAVRAAILKYASNMGLLDRKKIWKEITSHGSRKVFPKKLKKDLERLENEA